MGEGQQKSSNSSPPKLLPSKDLLSAAKSAVVHGVNRRLDASPNGGLPRRVAPGEVFSSPRSGASEVCGFHREHGMAFRIGYCTLLETDMVTVLHLKMVGF